MMRTLLFALWLAMLPAPGRAAEVTVTAVNPLDFQRQELIEIGLDSLRRRLGLAEGEPFVVRNPMGQQVAWQITHDGRLLIDAPVKPHGRTVYTVAPGTPEPMRSWVSGRMYPLRKDDIGWENDRGAYRVYGPAQQRTGERSFGIDVWTKNSKELDMAQRYYKDYEGNVTGWANAENGRKNRDIDLHTSFHLDHGNGMDCYGVGPTMGCGTPALMLGDSLVLPYCYQRYKILDNGPLRFTVELTYAPTRVGGDTLVTEHRIISLDKGSNFNRMTVWYEGLSRPRDLAAGFVIHTAGRESVVIGRDYVQYADPTDRPDRYGGQLYIGVLFPEGAQTRRLLYARASGSDEGHAVGVKKGLRNGERYTYYFGSAWSEYDVRTQAEWDLRVRQTLQMLARPLQVSLGSAR